MQSNTNSATLPTATTNPALRQRIQIIERYAAHPRARKKADMDPNRFFTATINALRAMGEHRAYSYWSMRELVIDDYEAGLTPQQSAAQFFAEWN
jgi:hypothetical protein